MQCGHAAEPSDGVDASVAHSMQCPCGHPHRARAILHDGPRVIAEETFGFRKARDSCWRPANKATAVGCEPDIAFAIDEHRASARVRAGLEAKGEVCASSVV